MRVWLRGWLCEPTSTPRPEIQASGGALCQSTHMLTDSLSVAMGTSSSSGCLQEGQGQGLVTALPTVHAAPHFALGPLLFLCAGEPPGPGMEAPPVADAPAGGPCPSLTFTSTRPAGSCLVRPSWLQERNQSLCLRLTPWHQGQAFRSWGYPLQPPQSWAEALVSSGT